MIRSVRGDLIRQVLAGQTGKGFPAKLLKAAIRKVAMIQGAQVLDDLRVPPGNPPEALSGNRAGQHSIRINDQWRICFVWTRKGPEQVEIVDDH